MSQTKDWCTPPHIVDAVRLSFGGSIELDPCSNEFSTVGAEVEYRLPERDGLLESWDYRSIYVNPPYGSDPERGTRMIHWFARMADAATGGSSVISLVPVATNTEHWKRYVYPVARSICFLYEPRLHFSIGGVRDPKGAPMACAMIYWGAEEGAFRDAFRAHGAVVSLTGVAVPV